MRSIFLSISSAIILASALFFGTPLLADPAPADPHPNALEEQIKVQNQQINEIQKKLESYDSNSRGLTHILETVKLLQESAKEAKGDTHQLLSHFITLLSISVVIFGALIGYGTFSQYRMKNEIKEARADVEEIRKLRKVAEREINEYRSERKIDKEEYRITRFETFAATALSLSLTWEKSTGEEREKLWIQANEYYKQATELQSEPIIDHHEEYAGVWNNWGNLLSAQEKLIDDLTSDLWQKADECYQKAITIKPDYAEAWYNWGNLLLEQARLTKDPVSDLWRRADACYQKAITIKPDNASVWNNRGGLLLEQARLTKDPASDLWQKADECYQKAITIKPDHASAWNNWGSLLLEQAELTKDPASDLWQRADACYQKAITIKPDHASAWYNRGNLLLEQAISATGSKPELWQQANRCYQNATTIKPDHAEAWCNWGSVLYNKAQLTDLNARQRTSLLEQAREKFVRAVELGFEPSKTLLKRCEEKIAELS